jgi:hypothetical protein
MSDFEKHHRLPRSRGGGNNPENLSRVRSKYHRAYHLLFGNMTPREMAMYLNAIWIDSNVQFVVRSKNGKGSPNPKQRTPKPVNP